MNRFGSGANRRLLSWFTIRRHWSDLTFLLCSLGLLLWIAEDAFGRRLVTLSQTADYWEHSAALRALIDNPWGPENPHLVSEAASPRFIPTFILAAVLARALGLDALGAMGIASCLNLLLFFGGISWFFRSYFRDARASLYGLIVMLGSWYDGWHFSNVYQLKILFSVASYPSTATIGLCLIGFAITLRTLRQSGSITWWTATAACWALVMITHPLTAMLGFSGAGLLALTEPNVPWRRRAWLVAAIFVGGLLSMLWPYFSVFNVLRGGGQEQVEGAVTELLSATPLEPLGNLHHFYRTRGLLNALGVAIAGLPICLFLIARRRHWFISLGALSMLLPFVVNAYLPLPLGHRFILLAIFFLQAGLVWFLLKLSPGFPASWTILSGGRRAWVAGLLVASTLGMMAYWNFVAARERVAYATRRLRGAESVSIRYAREVGQIAGSKSVVLTDARSGWPVPTFGPRVLTLLHSNPLVLDDAARNTAVAQFFRSGTPDELRHQIIKRWGVTHLLMRRGKTRQIQTFLSRHATGQRISGNYLLYELR